MAGAEAICSAIRTGLRISSVYAMFASNFAVRMVTRLARQPEETLATGVMLAGLGTRQQGQTRGRAPTHVGDTTHGRM